MLDFGLNQVTMSEAPLGDFLETAARLGCVGVELRNDLGRDLFDGKDAHTAGVQVRAHGLRLLGLSQVYPFNRWNDAVESQVKALIENAVEASAESISLIPCNDGTRLDPAERKADLLQAFEHCLPLLEQADMTALVEPLGFSRASVRLKSEVVEAIEAVQGGERLRIVHDTFHHSLAGETMIYPAQTGLVHISGVSHAFVALDHMEDADRGFIDGRDRLGNLEQINNLAAAGYDGVYSFECFAPEVRHAQNPLQALRNSIEFISTHMHRIAA